MSETNPLKAIEEALAKAASAPDATSATITEWLNARKQYLDQEAQERKQNFEQETQRSRTNFWRWALSVCFILLFVLILVWILNDRSVSTANPVATPSQTPAR
jgi:hypothetical protein